MLSFQGIRQAGYGSASYILHIVTTLDIHTQADSPLAARPPQHHGVKGTGVIS